MIFFSEATRFVLTFTFLGKFNVHKLLFILLGNSQGNEVILQVLRYCGSFTLFFVFVLIGKEFSGNNRNHPLYTKWG